MASSRGALVTVGQVGVLCKMGLMDKMDGRCPPSSTGLTAQHRALETMGKIVVSWGRWAWGVSVVTQVTAGTCSLSHVVMWILFTLPGLGSFTDKNCSLSYVQLSCYDQAKQLVLSTGYLSDNIFTHFVSSFIAVSAP